MVEDVEHFRAELKIEPLFELRVLEDAEVRLVQPLAAFIVAGDIAVYIAEERRRPGPIQNVAHIVGVDWRQHRVEIRIKLGIGYIERIESGRTGNKRKWVAISISAEESIKTCVLIHNGYRISRGSGIGQERTSGVKPGKSRLE